MARRVIARPLLLAVEYIEEGLASTFIAWLRIAGIKEKLSIALHPLASYLELASITKAQVATIERVA